MCKLYGCLPSALDNEDQWRVELHQEIQAGVDGYNRYEDASAARKAKRQGQ